MKQQVHDLGGVMSEDAIKASAAFQDSLQNLQTAVTETVELRFVAHLCINLREEACRIRTVAEDDILVQVRNDGLVEIAVVAGNKHRQNH